ncbi:hypothetical protein [Paenibacillus sp. GCM10028914]|uniref:hypothetical protein n=1 Tax=Paenibacillus sp. GCM10028914 TaxID=3273416 RepID=UPI00360AE517
MSYAHLSIIERRQLRQLEALHRLGWTAREIARELKRHHFTIAPRTKMRKNG